MLLQVNMRWEGYTLVHLVSPVLLHVMGRLFTYIVSPLSSGYGRGGYGGGYSSAYQGGYGYGGQQQQQYGGYPRRLSCAQSGTHNEVESGRKRSVK